MDFSSFLATSAKVLALFYSLVGLGALIAIHEFGHFLFCKFFGVHTPTFSIGFGPELFKRKIGNTNFRIAAIPLGGYVEIAGLAEVGQGDQAHATLRGEGSFADKIYWKKAFILLGGIIFNILFAYFIFCSFCVIGSFNASKQLSISYLIKNAAAEKYGLQENDIILGINGTTLSTDPITLNDQIESTLLKEIRANAKKEISLDITRNGKSKTLRITLDSRKDGSTELGVLGAAFHPIKLPIFHAFLAGIKYTNNLIVMLIKGIKNLFVSRNLDGVAGPVMILTQGAITASHGLFALLHFLALMSLGLAFTNLLPIGALDGGQLLFATVEAIIRRQIPEFIKLSINLASIVLILGLTLYFSYREIGMLFGDKIYAAYTKILGLIGR